MAPSEDSGLALRRRAARVQLAELKKSRRRKINLYYDRFLGVARRRSGQTEACCILFRCRKRD